MLDFIIITVFVFVRIHFVLHFAFASSTSFNVIISLHPSYRTSPRTYVRLFSRTFLGSDTFLSIGPVPHPHPPPRDPLSPTLNPIPRFCDALSQLSLSFGVVLMSVTLMMMIAMTSTSIVAFHPERKPCMCHVPCTDRTSGG